MKDLSANEWGLVLNGGGGKGAYQIGVFKALFEKKINDYISSVSGTSSGALNTILFCNGDLDVARKAWDEITPEAFIKIKLEMLDFSEGFVPRDGLLEIIDRYVDLEKIRLNEKCMYATVTDFGVNDEGTGVAKYYRLNYKPANEIKDILLASSALPIIYSPVIINGSVCRDGGLEDNMPIKPLYIEGIRHFIVVGLSENTRIPYEKYPDAEFILIKPESSIGDFIDGTLDFSQEGARKRMELGYIDAIRNLEFYGEDMNDEVVKFRYRESVKQDYSKIEVEDKKNSLENMINENMNKINSLFDQFMGE